MAGRVEIIHEAEIGKEGEYILCFHYCKFDYGDGNSEYGYRFMWRDPEGHLLPVRGQTRIPSIAYIKKLVAEAEKNGWGHYTEEEKPL